jgi:hypothetical protein
MIIAIDFDGTIVRDKYPEIGEIKDGAKEAINQLYADGYTIIIWSCRTGIDKARAIEWLVKQGIKFHYFNESCKWNVALYGGVDTRKVFADIYVDDRGLLAPLPHWDEIYWMVIDRIPIKREDKVIREGHL